MTRMLGLANVVGSTACSIAKGPSSNVVRVRSKGFIVPISPRANFWAPHLRWQWLMLALKRAASRIVPEEGHDQLFSSWPHGGDQSGHTIQLWLRRAARPRGGGPQRAKCIEIQSRQSAGVSSKRSERAA